MRVQWDEFISCWGQSHSVPAFILMYQEQNSTYAIMLAFLLWRISYKQRVKGQKISYSMKMWSLMKGIETEKC